MTSSVANVKQIVLRKDANAIKMGLSCTELCHCTECSNTNEEEVEEDENDEDEHSDADECSDNEDEQM